MKRPALLFFSYLFWILAACTALSMRIELLMRPTVTIVSPQSSFLQASGSVPVDCLFEDVNGRHLYTLVQEENWRAEIVAVEIPTDSYSVSNGDIITFATCIHYATKIPVDGESVSVLNYQSVSDDLLIMFDEDSVPYLTEAASGVEEVFRTQEASLWKVPKLPQPYMEKQAAALFHFGDYTPKHIFSLHELSHLLGEYPRLGLLVSISLLTLLLWCRWVALSRQSASSRAELIMTIIQFVLTLPLFILIVQGTQLPASLLPREYITQLSYYESTLSMLRRSLSTMATQGCSPAETILSAWNKANLSFLVCSLLWVPLYGITHFFTHALARRISNGSNQ